MAAKKSSTAQMKVSDNDAKSATKRNAKVMQGADASTSKSTNKKTATKLGAKATVKSVKQQAQVAPARASAVTKGKAKPKPPSQASKQVAAKTTAKRVSTSSKNVAPKRASAKVPKAVELEPAAPQMNDVAKATGARSDGLKVGERVPEFEALDQGGHKLSNRDWGGAPYVLYFYPKDDTPGCTTEACGFRDELPSFQELGVRVVGCSPDSPNAHTRFAAKYGLQFTLLADIEKNLAQLFGVWKLKQNYGREYMGVERSTFLVDKRGNVARVWRGVRVAGHVSEVLQAVRELS